MRNTGTVLGGRYALHEELGAGGMARVFRGRDLLLDRDVAVKVLRPELAADPAILQRFQQEARRAAGLAHPSVVAVYDVGIDRTVGDEAGTPYLVMELVPGETLKELARRGPLPPARAVELTLPVLSALEAAHRRGVVHRDVKPQNVLVTPDGAVKVTDFGIAAESGAPGVEPEAEDSILATAHYCSPEQAMGQLASPASDVYAVGVLLYELLTGRLPFPGDDVEAVARQQVEREPTPLRRLNSRVPPQLEAIVMRALAKSPQHRFASAEAMAAALRGWLAGFAERTSQLQPIRPDAAFGAARVGAAASPGLTTRSDVVDRALPGQAPPRAPGFNWVVILFSLALFACALAAFGGYQLFLRANNELRHNLPNPFANWSFPALPNPIVNRGGATTPTPTPTPTRAGPTQAPPRPATPPPAAVVVSPNPPTPPPTQTATATPTPTAQPTPTQRPAPPTPTQTPRPTVSAPALGFGPTTCALAPGGGRTSGEIYGIVQDRGSNQRVNGIQFQIREESGGWSATFPNGQNDSTDGSWWFVSLSTARYIITAHDPSTGASASTPPIEIQSQPSRHTRCDLVVYVSR